MARGGRAWLWLAALPIACSIDKDGLLSPASGGAGGSGGIAGLIGAGGFGLSGAGGTSSGGIGGTVVGGGGTTGTGAGGAGGFGGSVVDASLDVISDVSAEDGAAQDVADVLVPWQPTDFPNCVLWLDASDASTIATSGALVDSWSSKCGAATAAGSANARPQLTVLGGKSAVACDGVDDQLAITGSATDAPEYTLIVALSPTGAGTQQVIWSNRNAPPPTVGTGTHFGFANTSHLFVYQDSVLPSPVLVGLSTLPTGPWVVAFTMTSGAIRFLDINGVQYAAGSAVNGATKLLAGTFCADVPNAEHSQHRIFEVVMYDRGLSSAERSVASAALVAKWLQ